MSRIYFDKLIRDNVKRLIEAKGDKCEVRTLNEAEFKEALLTKVIEEATELKAANSREEFLA